MADGDKTPAKKEVKPTEYVILRRIEIADQPQGGPAIESPGSGFEAWAPIRNEQAEHGPDGEVRIFKGTGSKKQIIEQYAGKDGEDHPGFYRAIAVRSWKYGHGWVVPDKPKPEQISFE